MFMKHKIGVTHIKNYEGNISFIYEYSLLKAGRYYFENVRQLQ